MRARAATITLLFNDSKSRIDKFGISVKLSVSLVKDQFRELQVFWAVILRVPRVESGTILLMLASGGGMP
jgi:hypothetical protein